MEKRLAEWLFGNAIRKLNWDMRYGGMFARLRQAGANMGIAMAQASNAIRAFMKAWGAAFGEEISNGKKMD